MTKVLNIVQNLGMVGVGVGLELRRCIAACGLRPQAVAVVVVLLQLVVRGQNNLVVLVLLAVGCCRAVEVGFGWWS